MKQEIKERVERIRKGEVLDGYKETKVGIIPEDWNIIEIDKISEISTGNKDTKDKKNSGKYPFAVRSQKLEKIDTYSFDGEAVLTAGDGVGVGKVYHYINGKFDYHQRVYKISNFNSIIEGKYFFEFFKCFFRKRVYRMNAKNSVDSVRLNMIAKMPISLPIIKEQQKIAEILSTWDKAIELKEKFIEEKKEFKKGLMQKLLTGKMRFPEFTGEWKTAIIKDVFEDVKKINGNNSKEIDILTISAKHGFLSQKDKFSKVIAGSSLKKYTHLLQNEFAYNKGNSKTAPFGCIFKLDMKEGLVPFVYICFRPTQMIDVDFFDFYFKHGLLDRQLKRIITSGARSDGLLNVSKDDFFNIKISLPLIEEQKKIGLVLRLIQTEIDYLIDELNQLKEQKKGLMQLLLTGIVRVEMN